MQIVEIIKTVAGVAASVGSGAVVGNAIKASTPEDATKVGKVLIGIGGFVISSMLSDAAATYTENTIDAIASKISRTKVEIEVTVDDETVASGTIDPLKDVPEAPADEA